MKKTFAILVLFLFASVSFANPPVAEKVLKQFSESFPTVKDVKWYEGTNYYEAYFEKDEIKYHLFYDFNGKITGSRNYYIGEKLNPFLKAKVGEKYPGKKLFGVTEVSNAEELFYIVVLEDEKCWTNIRVDALGQITQLEKMYKTSN